MAIVFFVVTRLLFVACMVFIIGYVFGGFSKKPVLSRFARVASILVIVLFISTSAFYFRGGGWRYNNAYHHNRYCDGYYRDSVHAK